MKESTFQVRRSVPHRKARTRQDRSCLVDREPAGAIDVAERQAPASRVCPHPGLADRCQGTGTHRLANVGLGQSECFGEQDCRNDKACTVTFHLRHCDTTRFFGSGGRAISASVDRSRSVRKAASAERRRALRRQRVSIKQAPPSAPKHSTKGCPTSNNRMTWPSRISDAGRASTAPPPPP